MRKIPFMKMVASGNDFIVIDRRRTSAHLRGVDFHRAAKALCLRRYGIGADGVILIERPRKKACDMRMRIINADGSEAEMCGNGLRCAVLFTAQKRHTVKVETIAGVHEAELTGRCRVRIKMAPPRGIKETITLRINRRSLDTHFIDTGVPHAVIFVEGLDSIDVGTIGRKVRYNTRFMPRGTNVDFVEITDGHNIRMRTYERGVEGETQACGTGAVASAVMSGILQGLSGDIRVHAPGGILRVCFKNHNGRIHDVYLEGEAKAVYKGEVYYV